MDEKQWADPSPWVPMTRAIDKKHLGKLLEELGECVEVASGCLGPMDQDTWSQAKVKLENEMADVAANIGLCLDHFDMVDDMKKRRLPTGDGGTLLRDMVGACGGVIAAVSRCLIQGIDGEEPVTRKPNRAWFLEAVCRLLDGMVDIALSHNLDNDRMSERAKFKERHLRAWHTMLVEDG